MIECLEKIVQKEPGNAKGFQPLTNMTFFTYTVRAKATS